MCRMLLRRLGLRGTLLLGLVRDCTYTYIKRGIRLGVNWHGLGFKGLEDSGRGGSSYPACNWRVSKWRFWEDIVMIE